MKSTSENQFPSLSVETTVICVDRAKVDANNMLDIIISIINDVYQKWNFVITTHQEPQCKDKLI